MGWTVRKVTGHQDYQVTKATGQLGHPFGGGDGRVGGGKEFVYNKGSPSSEEDTGTSCGVMLEGLAGNAVGITFPRNNT